ncbi:hypothetical protein ACOME3_009391 [Neoechinorhynchus agilis]
MFQISLVQREMMAVDDSTSAKNEHRNTGISQTFIELDLVIAKLEYILLWRNRVLSLTFLILFDILMMYVRPYRPLTQFCILLMSLAIFDLGSRSLQLMYPKNDVRSMDVVKCSRMTQSIYRLTKFQRRKTIMICVSIAIVFYFLNNRPINALWHFCVIILFFYPNLVYNGLPPRIMKPLAKTLWHLDAAMKYERRSINVDEDDPLENCDRNSASISNFSSDDSAADSTIDTKRTVLVSNTEDEYDEVVYRSRHVPRSESVQIHNDGVKERSRKGGSGIEKQSGLRSKASHRGNQQTRHGRKRCTQK